MKKILLIVICISILLTSTGCGFLFPKEAEPEEEVIPYLENYFINNNEPTTSHAYESFKYQNAKSKPLSMGGHDYHGGFRIWTSAGPTEYGYATFSLEGKNYNKMSFMLGSYNPNGNADKEYNIVSVEVDGKQVIDALVWRHSVPERYTIDIAGAKEIKFKIIEGYAEVCVAELTVWEGEAQVTGYVKNNPTKKHLVKDLMPYFCQTHGKLVFTENTLPEYSDLWFMMDVEGNMQTEPVSVGGIDRMEGFALYMSIPLIGEDINYMYFNTEGDYEYLTFTVGCADLENVKEGQSWLSVYADGERVYEELVVSSALPKTVTIAIKGCESLKFETKYNTGGAHYVAVFDAYVGKTEADVGGKATEYKKPAADMPDTAKLISNLPPYFVHSAVEDPVFDGSTQYHTFSMGGRKYNEGIILMSSANWLFGNSHAYVAFNLDGEFDYLSFIIGHMQLHDVLKDDKLNVYLDGVLTYTFDCHATNLPEEHTIALKKCKELKLELEGMDSMYRPAFGIAEMVVFRGEAHENDLFAHEPVVCEDGVDMMTVFPPYEIYVSPMKDDKEDTIFDGSTKSHYFTVNGEKKYSGFMLQTSVHMSFDGDDVGAAVAFNLIGCTILALAAAGTAYESSYAAVHLEDKFKSVTFTVACPEVTNTSVVTEKLYIGGDWDIKKEIQLSNNMEPTTYTVNIDGCEQLMFWMECGDWWSDQYYFYDITLNK